jgi:predicted cupin superfamily sugar epimerase
MQPNAETLIQELDLQPLPVEGGYFTVSFTADEKLPPEALPERYELVRNLSGAILFLETPEQFSAMHQLKTDEIYYHHCGDPVEMLFLAPDGTGWTAILGIDIIAGQRPQILAPRDHWHGSRPLPGSPHGFALMSTSMAPGYDPIEAEYAKRDELVELYPSHCELIRALTRVVPWNV